MSFIESKEVACSDSVSHNRLQVSRIPLLLHQASSQKFRQLVLIDKKTKPNINYQEG